MRAGVGCPMAETVYDKVLVRRTVSPALRANGTVNGSAVDRAANGGAEEAMVVVVTGTITDGSHAVTIEDSADGISGWAPVTGQLQGAAPTVVAANDDTQFEVGVGFSRQFLRVSIVTSGATTGGIIGAVVVLGDMRHVPISHA